LRAYEEVGVEQFIGRIGSDDFFGSGTEFLALFLTEASLSVSTVLMRWRATRVGFPFSCATGTVITSV
jgi:hypothetical protein